MAVQILMLRLRHLPHFRQPSQLRSKRIQKKKNRTRHLDRNSERIPRSLLQGNLECLLDTVCPRILFRSVFKTPSKAQWLRCPAD